MATYETYKNTVISDGGAYDGETELGDQAYPAGSTHPDGTPVSLPAQDDLLSRVLVCGVCGFPVKDKAAKQAMTKQRGVMVCPDCKDDPAPGRREY